MKRDWLLQVMEFQSLLSEWGICCASASFKHICSEAVKEWTDKRVLHNLTSWSCCRCFDQAKGTNRSPQEQGCHHVPPAAPNLRAGWTSPSCFPVPPTVTVAGHWGHSKQGSGEKKPKNPQPTWRTTHPSKGLKITGKKGAGKWRDCPEVLQELSSRARIWSKGFQSPAQPVFDRLMLSPSDSVLDNSLWAWKYFSS